MWWLVEWHRLTVQQIEHGRRLLVLKINEQHTPAHDMWTLWTTWRLVHWPLTRRWYKKMAAAASSPLYQTCQPYLSTINREYTNFIIALTHWLALHKKAKHTDFGYLKQYSMIDIALATSQFIRFIILIILYENGDITLQHIDIYATRCWWYHPLWFFGCFWCPSTLRVAVKISIKLQFLGDRSPPFPQIDIIWDVVIVWRVRGKTIRSVLCNIVCNNCAQCNAHTYEQPNSSLDWVLSHWAHFTVLRFIFVLRITVCCMHA